MELIDHKLSGIELEDMADRYGDYMKITVDVENGWIVVGPELPTTAGRHVDAVPMLKEKGSMEENIWGGWIGLGDKVIDTMAVWNLRSEPNNPGMDILDGKIREKFIGVVKNIFGYLWT